MCDLQLNGFYVKMFSLMMVSIHESLQMNFKFDIDLQVDEDKPVLVPGDPERAHMDKVDEEGGIRYHINQLNASDKLAERFNVDKLGSH